MNLKAAMEARHAVRQYQDKPLDPTVAKALRAEIEAGNRAGGLRMQLIENEPEAFAGFMARRGSFEGVTDYVALIGAKAPDLDGRIGYYGERVALMAQALGLNTCWVAMTFSKGKCPAKVGPNEKIVCVLSLGYGRTQGQAHASKKPADVATASGGAAWPAWFAAGVDAALLAPTAMNQQKFRFELLEAGGAGSPGRVRATTGMGPFAKVDLGIAKLHFELGAGEGTFAWAE